MKKICLSVVGLFLLLFQAWAQAPQNDYKNLNLKVEDANIVSGYYSQTGNHSAVTGGIGTQQLTDVSNNIDLKLARYDILNRKHTFNIEVGLDHHTAASSANVSKTGASATGGTRFYPSFNWQVENNEKRTTFGLGASYSGEYTYHSYGFNILFAKRSKDDNREFTAKGNLYLDAVKMVEPSELQPTTTTTVYTSASRGGGTSASSSIPNSSRTTFDASFALSQVVTKRFQVALLTDAVLQQGYLGLPFYRVYFADGSDHIENMPSTRFKLPLGLRANYFLSDRFVLKSYYRFYTDSWGLRSNTFSLETPVKITPFISVSPYCRYYKQTAATFFAPYESHTAADTYYTSDYSYAAFNSTTEGVNLRIAPPNGVLGMKGLGALELRYGSYSQTTGLKGQSISLNLTVK